MSIHRFICRWCGELHDETGELHDETCIIEVEVKGDLFASPSRCPFDGRKRKWERT